MKNLTITLKTILPSRMGDKKWILFLVLFVGATKAQALSGTIVGDFQPCQTSSVSVYITVADFDPTILVTGISWSISPSSAGSISSFFGTANITWNPAFYGIATLNANYYNSSVQLVGSAVPKNISLSGPAGALTPPSGPSNPCQGSSNTYTVNVPNMKDYLWLTPPGATIVPAGPTATVNWSPSFSGQSAVSVVVLDNCGNVSTAITSVNVSAKSTWYQDADGDSYGNPGSSTQACTAPGGYVSNNSDCNDGNYYVNPGIVEYCNGLDDDCDGAIDEGVMNTFYADADGDGFGNPAITTLACNVPDGYRPNDADCDDANAAINPNATERCNIIDDNCNGQIDEGTAFSCSVEVSPLTTVSPGGLPNTIYLGYGAQCVTLTVSASISGIFTYEWSTAQTTASISVCPTVTTIYSVTVTNTANGCTSTCSVQICVIDARSMQNGQPDGKLLVCHTPSTTPNTLSISSRAVPLHLGHGDYLGACGAVCNARTESNSVEQSSQEPKLYPNPSNGKFILELVMNEPLNNYAIVQVISKVGQTVFNEKVELTFGALRKEIQLNDAAPGIYFVRIIAGDQIFTKKIEVVQ